MQSFTHYLNSSFFSLISSFTYSLILSSTPLSILSRYLVVDKQLEGQAGTLQ